MCGANIHIVVFPCASSVWGGDRVSALLYDGRSGGLEIPERIKFYFEMKLMAIAFVLFVFSSVNRCYLFGFFRTGCDLGSTNLDGTCESIYWSENTFFF